MELLELLWRIGELISVNIQTWAWHRQVIYMCYLFLPLAGPWRERRAFVLSVLGRWGEHTGPQASAAKGEGSVLERQQVGSNTLSRLS